jgi:hypothetical protein
LERSILDKYLKGVGETTSIDIILGDCKKISGYANRVYTLIKRVNQGL